jgi:uncharacterized protein (DUF488 family)
VATIWTIGHSNVPFEVLLDSLRAASIERVVDVRRFPRSRRHPQFNIDALAASLAEAGIAYEHSPSLGGRRESLEDSPNAGLRDEGFRGFADYMGAGEFKHALSELIRTSSLKRTAIMCAESLPWRCHRSLIADALVARGSDVLHILGGQQKAHNLNPSARIQEGNVSYPALL